MDQTDQKVNMEEKKKKSLWMTYLCWLIGGWWGLHHFYLERDRHAFITWMSIGCYFGAGLFRDLWRIPVYVRDANKDPELQEDFKYLMKKCSKPTASLARHCGTIIIADILGYLFIGAIPTDLLPEYSLKYICAIVAPLGVALGVHLVGNAGRSKGSIKWAAIGAYLTAPLYYLTTNSVFWTSMCSTFLFNHMGKKWRKSAPKAKTSIRRRLAVLSLCGLLYITLWTSWLYFNCSIVDQNDEEIKCRDAAKNFMNSPVWKDVTGVMRDLYNYALHHGWRGIWTEIVNAFDPQGETNAMRVLNLPPEATQEQITATYKKLARQWHPDRHKTEEAKKQAQETFIQIQQAYETLSRIKHKRIRMNKRERPEAGQVFERDEL
ncbi:DnaJ -like protein subfamily C member 22 [Halotydeus destructor]|nr:DnaJ -like protein subfamily C member 22 [Halotydeus destructor]